MNETQLAALLEYVEALIELEIVRHDPLIDNIGPESLRQMRLLEDLKKLFSNPN